MKPREIILIYPNPVFPGNNIWHCRLSSLPLSIMSLVPSLEKNGFVTRMIDTRDRDYRLVEYDNALFVGISTQTGVQIKNGLEVAGFIRKNYPDVPIVWGGIHPSILPEETILHPLVDIVCEGEGEETVVDLAMALCNQQDVGQVPGLTFKGANGKIISTHPRSFVDMDSLGHLPFENLNMKRYGHKVEMFTSRGCPNRCTFCYNRTYHRSRWRSKSAEKVIDDIQHAATTVNPPNIVNFCDDNFFVNQRRIVEICEGKIKRNISFTWTAFCCADYFRKYDGDFLELLARSGCSVIDFGGESGSEKILERIGKGISRDDIMNAAKKCDSAGIGARFSFIFGFPEETHTDREATFSLIDSLISECKRVQFYGIYLLTPYPGTPDYKDALKRGFNTPRSLDEWGEYKFADFRNIPWCDKNDADYLRTISRLTRFKFYPQAGGHPYPRLWKNIIYELLSIDSRLRWRFKLFDFPFEWLLYDSHCRKRHKY